MNNLVLFGLLALASTGNCAASPPLQFDDVRIAHGVLASVSFAVFMPLGAIAMRTLSFKNLVWYHAAWMLFAYALALAAMGMGIWMALTIDYLHRPHIIIGLVVICSVVLQPVTGLVHHLLWKRNGRRSAFSYAHVWYGRAIITLAIINGGIGLSYARPYQPGARKGEIVYGAVAGTIWLTWMAVILAGFIKARGDKETESGDSINKVDDEKRSENGAHMSETGSGSANQSA